MDCSRTRMDYRETRSSLIFYLYRLVDKDSWRINMSLGKFRVTSDLYRILLDVLSEFVNVRYGNLRDASEDEVYHVIFEDLPPSFKDEKALRYIKITYLLYNNIRDLPWNLSDTICKTIREGKYECQK